MAVAGERLQLKRKEGLGDGGTVLHVSQVAHVTFYITEQEHPQRYKLFTESADRGVQQAWDEEGDPDDNCSPFDYSYDSYEDATKALLKKQARLEQILEKKRKGYPTPKQLHFLFRHGMPIPPDLTWGQASDTIDECIAQEVQRKRREQSEKFNGFTVGMKVYSYSNPIRGVWQSNRGEIVKLTSNNNGIKYAYVKWEDEENIYWIPAPRVDIRTLWKIEASEGQLRAIESKKFFPGEKVLYPPYGVGIVLHAGMTSAGIQFQNSKLTVPLTELTLAEQAEPTLNS